MKLYDKQWEFPTVRTLIVRNIWSYFRINTSLYMLDVLMRKNRKSVQDRFEAHIQSYELKRLGLQLWTFFDFFIFFLNHFKSFVKVELSYVFTINLFTIAENCTEKWIIL